MTVSTKATWPNAIEVQQVMQRMQQTIVEHSIPPKFTFSSDETGVFYGQGPKYQWVPKGATAGGTRATLDHANLTNQFTDCLTAMQRAISSR